MKSKFYSLITALFLSLLSAASITNAIGAKILEHSSNDFTNKWVYESHGERCLSFLKPPPKIVQGCINLNNPYLIEHGYLKLFVGAGLALNPAPKKILLIGLGTAGVPKTFSKIYPEAELDIVEIDKDIPTLAEKYFYFKLIKTHHLFIEDGVKFVEKAPDNQYDLIFVDAYNETYIPPEFLTDNFTYNVKRILTDNGIVAVNTFWQNEEYYQKESDLYSKFFGNFINLTVGSSRVIFASKGNFPDVDTIKSNATKWQDQFTTVGIKRGWVPNKFGIMHSEKIILPETKPSFKVE